MEYTKDPIGLIKSGDISEMCNIKGIGFTRAKDIVAKFGGMEGWRFRYFFIFAANDEDIEFSVETGIDGSRKIVERESALTSAEKK